METGTKVFNNQESYTLVDLVDINKLQELLLRFYDLTGYSVGITDTNNKVLVSIGWKEICTAFHRKNSASYKNCLESDQYVQKHLDNEKFISYKCKNGLWDAAYPIKVSGKHLATLFFGQFFFSEEEKDIAYFTRQAEKYNFNTDTYIEALKKILEKRSTIVLSADTEPFKLLKQIPDIQPKKSGKTKK